MAGERAKGNFITQNLPFLIFFAIFLMLAWEITAPMAAALMWAAMLSFIASPIYRTVGSRLLRGRWPNAAAGLTLVLLLLICFIPLVFMLSTLGSEAAGLGAQVTKLFTAIKRQALSPGSSELPDWIPAAAAAYIQSFLKNSEAVKTAVADIAQISATLLSSLSARLIEQGSSFLLNVLIALMVSFFFIRDGAAIVDYVRSVTPLSPEERDSFYLRTASILHSVFYGVILTVAVQAILGALGWWFVGLGSPVFFGMLMFFFGMFPAGTAVVWVPGAAWLALSGNTRGAIILFLWGALIVGTVDNLLRPFIISSGHNGEEIPTLLIILGLFGGVMKWGFLGIFVGPLVLVLFVSVCDLYRKRWLNR